MTRTVVALVLSLAGLAACSGVPPRPADAGAAQLAYQQRSAALQRVTAWDLVGQLAMDDGADGGSGRLHWRVREDSTRLDFRGALGRGAWRLSIEPEGALLEKGDGTRTEAPTVDELIQQEIGWRIPVRSLQRWVLGIAAPGEYAGADIDGEGLLRRLEQDSWNIEFVSYQAIDGIRVPRKMEAVSGQYRVKLAISRWVLQTGAADGG